MFVAYARYELRGPVRPYPESDTITRRGLTASRSSNEQSQCGIVSAPKFSITTSATATSRRKSARPSSVFISSEMLRVLRDNPPYMTVLGTPDGSTTNFGPKPYAGLRSTSGRASASIFTTSAPSSASRSPVVFPAMNDPKVRTRSWSMVRPRLPVRLGTVSRTLGERGSLGVVLAEAGRGAIDANSSGDDRNGAPGMRTSRPSAPRQGHEVVPRRELLVLDELGRGVQDRARQAGGLAELDQLASGCGPRGAR